jgi:hypothetical protein
VREEVNHMMRGDSIVERGGNFCAGILMSYEGCGECLQRLWRKYCELCPTSTTSFVM